VLPERISQAMAAESVSEGARAAALPLVEGWLRQYADDKQLRIIAVEREFVEEIAPDTWLIGRIDLEAEGEIGVFSGDWKSVNRYKPNWAADFQLSVQGLTYGLVTKGKRFTRRIAVKTPKLKFDHAWFTYSEDELSTWRRQIVNLAERVRQLRRQEAPWNLGPARCLRYGEKYPCPFYYKRCLKTNFVNLDGLRVRPRRPTALSFSVNKNTVILSATRLEDLLDCEEMFRSKHEERLEPIEADRTALDVGTLLHTGVGQWYRMIKEEQDGRASGSSNSSSA